MTASAQCADLLRDIDEVERRVETFTHDDSVVPHLLHRLRQHAVLVAWAQQLQLRGWTDERWRAAIAAGVHVVAAEARSLGQEVQQQLSQHRLDPSVHATLSSVLPHLYQKLLAASGAAGPSDAAAVEGLHRTGSASGGGCSACAGFAARLEACEAHNHELERELDAAERQQGLLVEKLDAAEAQARKQGAASALLRRRVDEHEASARSADELEAQLRASKAEVAALERRLAELAEECAALGGAADALRSDARALAAENGALESEAQRLRWRVQALEEDRELAAAEAPRGGPVGAASRELPGAAAASPAWDAGIRDVLASANRYSSPENSSPPGSPPATLARLLSLSPHGSESSLSPPRPPPPVPESPAKRTADAAAESAQPLKRQALRRSASAPFAASLRRSGCAPSIANLTAARSRSDASELPDAPQASGVPRWPGLGPSKHALGCSDACQRQDAAVQCESVFGRVDAACQCEAADMGSPASGYGLGECVGDAASPVAELAAQAVEQGIEAICATNAMLRQFHGRFLAQMRGLAGQVESARRGGKEGARGPASDVTPTFDSLLPPRPPASAAAHGDCGPAGLAPTVQASLRGAPFGSAVATAAVPRALSLGSNVARELFLQSARAEGVALDDVSPVMGALEQVVSSSSVPWGGVRSSAAPPSDSGSATVSVDGTGRHFDREFRQIMAEASRQKAAALQALAPSLPSSRGTPASGTPEWAASPRGADSGSFGEGAGAASMLWEGTLKALSEQGAQVHKPAALRHAITASSGGPPSSHQGDSDPFTAPPRASAVLPSAADFHAEALPVRGAAVRGTTLSSSSGAQSGALQLEALQRSMHSAAAQQQLLVDALEAELDGTSARVAAAALELDAVRTELDALREQASQEGRALGQAKALRQQEEALLEGVRREVEAARGKLSRLSTAARHRASENAPAAAQFAWLRQSHASASGSEPRAPAWPGLGAPPAKAVGGGRGAAGGAAAWATARASGLSRRSEVASSRQSVDENDARAAVGVDAIDSVNPLLLSMDSDVAGASLSMAPPPPRLPSHTEAPGAAPQPAFEPGDAAAERCESPHAVGSRSGRRGDPSCRGESGEVVVHVDVAEMRRLLEDWRSRGLPGDPPAGLRVMSQWEHLIDAATDELARLDRGIQEQRQLATHLGLQISQFSHELAALQAEFERSQAAAADAAARVHARRAEHQALVDALPAVRRAADEAQDREQGALARLERLQRECSEREAAAQRADQEREALETSLREASEEARRLDHLREEHSTALRAIEHETKEAQISLQLTRELAAHQQRLLEAARAAHAGARADATLGGEQRTSLAVDAAAQTAPPANRCDAAQQMPEAQQAMVDASTSTSCDAPAGGDRGAPASALQEQVRELQLALAHVASGAALTPSVRRSTTPPSARPGSSPASQLQGVCDSLSQVMGGIASLCQPPPDDRRHTPAARETQTDTSAHATAAPQVADGAVDDRRAAVAPATADAAVQTDVPPAEATGTSASATAEATALVLEKQRELGTLERQLADAARALEQAQQALDARVRESKRAAARALEEGARADEAAARCECLCHEASLYEEALRNAKAALAEQQAHMDADSRNCNAHETHLEAAELASEAGPTNEARQRAEAAWAQRVQALEDRAASLQGDIERSAAELQDAEAAIWEATTEAQNVRSRVEALEREVAARSAEAADAMASLAAAREELDAVRAAAADARAASDAHCSAAKVAAASAREAADAAALELRALRADADAARAQLVAETASLLRQQAELEGVRTARAQEERAAADLAARVVAEEGALRQLREEVAALEGRRREEAAALTAAEAQMGACRERVEAAQAEAQQAAQLMERMDVLVAQEQLQEEVAALEGRRREEEAALAARVVAEEGALMQLREEVAALEGRRREEEAALAAAEAQMGACRERVEALVAQEQVVELRAQVQAAAAVGASGGQAPAAPAALECGARPSPGSCEALRAYAAELEQARAQLREAWEEARALKRDASAAMAAWRADAEEVAAAVRSGAALQTEFRNLQGAMADAGLQAGLLQAVAVLLLEGEQVCARKKLTTAFRAATRDVRAALLRFAPPLSATQRDDADGRTAAGGAAPDAPPGASSRAGDWEACQRRAQPEADQAAPGGPRLEGCLAELHGAFSAAGAAITDMLAENALLRGALTHLPAALLRAVHPAAPEAPAGGGSRLERVREAVAAVAGLAAEAAALEASDADGPLVAALAAAPVATQAALQRRAAAGRAALAAISCGTDAAAELQQQLGAANAGARREAAVEATQPSLGSCSIPGGAPDRRHPPWSPHEHFDSGLKGVPAPEGGAGLDASCGGAGPSSGGETGPCSKAELRVQASKARAKALAKVRDAYARELSKARCQSS